MAPRRGRGMLGNFLWGFMVLSVAFAIIGNPTVGPEKFKYNLVERADGFKKIVADLMDGFDKPPAAPSSNDPAPAPTKTSAPSAKPSKNADASAHATEVDPNVKGRGVNLIADLKVSDKKLKGYDRDNWNHWIRARKGCWSVRDEVLYRDAKPGTVVLLDSNDSVTTNVNKACEVKSGFWKDPYSKLTFTDPGDIDIDHVVPLAATAESGGQQWSKGRKEAYANDLKDPNHLRASAATMNRSKGAQTPSTWRPIDRSRWCWYAGSWTNIKIRWGLTVSRAELAALKEMAATCQK